MILKWIEKTRKKPKEVRNQYAFFGAVVVTGFIVVLWVVSLPSQLARIEESKEGDETPKGAFSQFITDAKQNFAGAFAANTDEAPAISEEATSTVPEVTEEPAVVLPDLTQENIEGLEREAAIENEPPPKQVLIATTSKATTTSTEE